jgi:hypothetical protein
VFDYILCIFIILKDYKHSETTPNTFKVKNTCWYIKMHATSHAQIIQGVMDSAKLSWIICLLTFILFSSFITNEVINYFSVWFLRSIPGHHQTAHCDVRKPQIAWRTRQTLIRIQTGVTEGVTKYSHLTFAVRSECNLVVFKNMHFTFWQCIPTYIWKEAGLFEAMKVPYAETCEGMKVSYAWSSEATTGSGHVCSHNQPWSDNIILSKLPHPTRSYKNVMQ